MSRCHIQSSGRLAQSHLAANFLSKKYKNFQDATSKNSKVIVSLMEISSLISDPVEFRMGEVKVIGASLSLFCCRIEWALKLKGVEYEYIEENLRNKSPILLQYNPVHKKIPVLVHNGKPVAESLVILEYIDETWQENPLLPKDPLEKSTARFWARFVDEKCILSAWAACRAQEHEKEKAVESAQESLGIIDKLIEGKKFFGGETIGFLDLVVGSLPNWLKFLEELEGIKLVDAEKFPSFHEWSKKFVEIPIIKEKIPMPEDLINYFTTSGLAKTIHGSALANNK